MIHMSQFTKVISLVIRKDLYHKLVIVSMVMKMFYGDKRMSKSTLINIAIDEYFKNHDAEIKELMRKYHDDGGCADI